MSLEEQVARHFEKKLKWSDIKELVREAFYTQDDVPAWMLEPNKPKTKKEMDKVILTLIQKQFPNAVVKSQTSGSTTIENVGDASYRSEFLKQTLIPKLEKWGVKWKPRKYKRNQNLFIGLDYELEGGAGTVNLKAGKQGKTDKMCGNDATCFENNIIYGIKLLNDPQKASQFYREEDGQFMGTVFADKKASTLDPNAIFDPTGKGGNFIIKSSLDAGKLCAKNIIDQAAKAGWTITDAAEASGQSYELTDLYKDAGVKSGESKTDITLFAGDEAIHCSVKEMDSNTVTGEGGQYAAAQANEFSAIARVALSAWKKSDPSDYENKMAELSPERIGNMLQAIMQKSAFYRAQENWLSQDPKAKLVKEDDVEAKNSIDPDLLKKSQDLDSRRQALQKNKDTKQDTIDPRKLANAERFKKDQKGKKKAFKVFSDQERSAMQKVTSHYLGLDHAIKQTSSDVVSDVKRMKEVFTNAPTGEATRLREDIVDQILAFPIDPNAEVKEGQARYDAAEAGELWDELSESRRKAYLKEAGIKLSGVAQVKLMEAMQSGLEDLQRTSSEQMQAIFETPAVRMAMVREAVTGEQKFKSQDGVASSAVPTALVAWNYDGSASFKSFRGTASNTGDAAEAAITKYFEEKAGQVRIELRDRGTGRGLAARMEPRKKSQVQEILTNSENVSLEDFMRFMGAGHFLVMEQTLNSELLVESYLMNESELWSALKQKAVDFAQSAIEKGSDVVDAVAAATEKAKKHWVEIIKKAKQVVRAAVEGAKNFYKQVKEFFSRVVAETVEKIKAFLGEDPVNKLMDLNNIEPIIIE